MDCLHCWFGGFDLFGFALCFCLCIAGLFLGWLGFIWVLWIAWVGFVFRSCYECCVIGFRFCFDGLLIGGVGGFCGVGCFDGFCWFC